jgi:hypothetical protein
MTNKTQFSKAIDSLTDDQTIIEQCATIMAQMYSNEELRALLNESPKTDDNLDFEIFTKALELKNKNKIKK